MISCKVLKIQMLKKTKIAFRQSDSLNLHFETRFKIYLQKIDVYIKIDNRHHNRKMYPHYTHRAF